MEYYRKCEERRYRDFLDSLSDNISFDSDRWICEKRLKNQSQLLSKVTIYFSRDIVNIIGNSRLIFPMTLWEYSPRPCSMTYQTEKRHSPKATPFPENNLMLFYSAAPLGRRFALHFQETVVRIGDIQESAGEFIIMRRMEFKMERPGLLEEGQSITVTEGVLPSNYYYTIDPALAMSANIPFRDRLKCKEGRVIKIEENPRGFYVMAEFDEPEAEN